MAAAPIPPVYSDHSISFAPLYLHRALGRIIQTQEVENACCKTAIVGQTKQGYVTVESYSAGSLL